MLIKTTSKKFSIRANRMIIYSQRNDTSFSENTYKTNSRNTAVFKVSYAGTGGKKGYNVKGFIIKFVKIIPVPLRLSSQKFRIRSAYSITEKESARGKRKKDRLTYFQLYCYITYEFSIYKQQTRNTFSLISAKGRGKKEARGNFSLGNKHSLPAKTIRLPIFRVKGYLTLPPRLIRIRICKALSNPPRRASFPLARALSFSLTVMIINTHVLNYFLLAIKTVQR